MKRLLVVASLFIASLSAADERGLSIAREADRRDQGFVNFTADMKMTLIDSGSEVVRELKRSTLEVIGDGDRSLNTFTTPRDVSGTAVLTYAHPTEPDEQWILLPALRRVKRIATNNKSGPFLGSEFSFEDLAAAEVEKYSYKLLREEPLDGDDCFVMELTPQYEHSGYSKLVQWLDKKIYQPRRIDYYDRKGELLKTLSFSEYEQFEGKHWRAKRMEMVNVISKKRTKLEWSNFRFKTPLKEGDFTVTALNRVQGG